MKSCRKGHPRTAENSYQGCNGYPVCRVCVRLKQQRRYEQDYRSTSTHRVIPEREQVTR